MAQFRFTFMNVSINLSFERISKPRSNGSIILKQELFILRLKYYTVLLKIFRTLTCRDSGKLEEIELLEKVFKRSSDI